MSACKSTSVSPFCPALDMTLSLGYAKGFGNDIIPDDEEFMLLSRS